MNENLKTNSAENSSNVFRIFFTVTAKHNTEKTHLAMKHARRFWKR